MTDEDLPPALSRRTTLTATPVTSSYTTALPPPLGSETVGSPSTAPSLPSTVASLSPPVELEVAVCPICYDNISGLPPSSFITTPCGHEFCTSCWDRFFLTRLSHVHLISPPRFSCPMCRHPIPIPAPFASLVPLPDHNTGDWFLWLGAWRDLKWGRPSGLVLGLPPRAHQEAHGAGWANPPPR